MAHSFLSLLLVLSATLFAIARGAGVPESRDFQRRDENLPARVPYIFPEPGTDPIADAIRARRNGTLLALDGALLNAPLVAQAWNQFFTVIRGQLTIPDDMRELFILRTAVVNNAAYEWLQHESVGRAAGLTTQKLRVIRFAPRGGSTPLDKSILGSSLSAALEFADAIADTPNVPKHIYDNLAKHLSPKQIVEAVATAGGYALVARFTESLDVDGRANEPVPVPQ